MNRSLVGACPQADAYVGESPAQQLWSGTKGKKQCDSYYRQGGGGGSRGVGFVRDVMLG